MPVSQSDSAALSDDPERDRIVAEEESCLQRVTSHLAQNKQRVRAARDSAEYDARLLDLRDQIASARLEDIPPLVQEMERLQSLAAHLRETTESEVDPRSPYFGRLVLEEGERKREVLIGRGTHLDTRENIRIVDWRDAPVSRLYYRYEEGEEYDEEFGGREVSGTVNVRRSLVITDAVLRRVGTPQGSFARTRDGSFRRLEATQTRLAGGAGSAIRAEQHHRPGKLGTGKDRGEDKQLKEITPLIDRRQFELITRPDSGLVVIQGGAGSGKTTIGLHRLAYLAFQDPRRFRPDRMLVIVFNAALARYINGVLPALGVNGVAIRTYEDFVSRLRQALFPRLPSHYREDAPAVVTRLKKHPAMLHAIEAHVARFEAKLDVEVRAALAEEARTPGAAATLLEGWDRSRKRIIAHRLHALSTRLEEAEMRQLSTNARVSLERTIKNGISAARDVAQHWAELLSDRALIRKVYRDRAGGDFTDADLERAHTYCAARVSEVLDELIEKSERRAERREERGRDEEDEGKGRGRSRKSEDDDDDDSADPAPRVGVDGRDVEDRARLEPEDDTLILRLSQRLRGPLTRSATSKDPVIYEHILIDEAQDLSPVELAVVMNTVNRSESVTLAGDIQQRLLLDNGFTNWKEVLGELGLSHVEVEPLKLSYRSTHEIIAFARHVLGPLVSPDAPEATRHGAPVELFAFGHMGDSVAFLADALRDLLSEEPNASIAVVTRFPEQADAYYDGLRHGEVPKLRRITDQDFPFKPGVDVTDVRQVKGLEFDYVVLAEVGETAYPIDDEARHLLHIGATRAAHQLWVLCSGKPSPLLPEDLVSQSL
ncbi:MAG TPA: ATP-binding domain-containing protein [Polyangiaceae bacterium]|nr:ATP-binding domain-containing protein [Polyangiaceae bacterium]